jgi:hypothetical protein
MKIKILVDIAYALDMLSILEVKREVVDDPRVEKEYTSLYKDISAQSDGKMDEIMASAEYRELYDSNRRVFEAVGEAKEDKVKASEVDRLNTGRWSAKNKLQKRFFNSVTDEVKV